MEKIDLIWRIKKALKQSLKASLKFLIRMLDKIFSELLYFKWVCSNVVEQIVSLISSWGTLFPSLSEKIQLTGIYLFAFADVSTVCLTEIAGFSDDSTQLSFLAPLVKSLGPLHHLFVNQSYIFLLLWVIMEYFVIKPRVKCSVLVKFHLLLVFILLLVQGGVMLFWDVIFEKVTSPEAEKYVYGSESLYDENHILAILCYFITFMSFTPLYLYLYKSSLQKNFVMLPFAPWLTDSVFYWLQIISPSMKKRFKLK